MMGMGEKPRNMYKLREKNMYKLRKKKFPVWFPSHPPVYENGGRLFSGVRKDRKQAGPSLGGTGALI